MSYSVSPQGDKLYAVASLGHESLGTWEYDIASKTSGSFLPKNIHSRSAILLHRANALLSGTVKQFLTLCFRPPEFDPHKKYPVSN